MGALTQIALATCLCCGNQEIRLQSQKFQTERMLHALCNMPDFHPLLFHSELQCRDAGSDNQQVTDLAFSSAVLPFLPPLLT